MRSHGSGHKRLPEYSVQYRCTRGTPNLRLRAPRLRGFLLRLLLLLLLLSMLLLVLLPMLPLPRPELLMPSLLSSTVSVVVLGVQPRLCCVWALSTGPRASLILTSLSTHVSRP